MKNFLFFLIIIFLVGCDSIIKPSQVSKNLICPGVFFSLEHKKYLFSEKNKINLDNISFKANINNFVFNEKCQSFNDIQFYPIDILIIVEPFMLKDKNVKLPIYAALLDKKENLIDIQYFSITNKVNYDEVLHSFEETDNQSRLDIFTKSKAVSSIIIGFMLEKEKLKLIY